MKLTYIIPVLHSAGSLAFFTENEEQKALWSRDLEETLLLNARGVQLSEALYSDQQRRSILDALQPQTLTRRGLDYSSTDEYSTGYLSFGRRSVNNLQRRGGCFGKPCQIRWPSPPSSAGNSPAQSRQNLNTGAATAGRRGSVEGSHPQSRTQTLEQAGLGEIQPLQEGGRSSHR